MRLFKTEINILVEIVDFGLFRTDTSDVTNRTMNALDRLESLGLIRESTEIHDWNKDVITIYTRA